MNGPVLRVAWYRFRATFRRRLGGYLTLAVLIGLVGGVAMGSMVAARRTYASYPKFLASTNPSDLIVQPTTTPTYSPRFLDQLARLPDVRKVATSAGFTAATLTPRGRIGTFLLTQVELIASLNGLYSSEDRLTITTGHVADPRRADQIVASTEAAAVLGLHVGSHVSVGIVANASQHASFYRKLNLTVVGLGVFNIQVVQDDIEKDRTGFLVGTPALARLIVPCCASYEYVGLRLAGGSKDDSFVEQKYDQLLSTSSYTRGDSGSLLQVYVTSAIEDEAQRAIRPEAIALGVFGVIAGLAALLIGLQAISRQLRAGAEDTGVLRGLGAGPAATMADGLLGVIGAVIAGALLAAGVAMSLSPLSLFGPVREVEPSRGVYLDWVVLGLGPLILVAVLGVMAAALAYRQAPHRAAARQPAGEGGSGLVRAALAAGLPASGVAGLRFALEAGRGPTAVPVRSVMAGAALAIGVVTATLTFGASLNTLVSHPALYGWNFNYALYSTDGYGSFPANMVDPVLASDRSVAATTGVYFLTAQIDGQTVPAIAAPASAAVAPPMLSGHPVDGSRQIILGPATLAQLDKQVGDTVWVSEGSVVPGVRLKIVGTATLPTIGTVLGVHASMSTGALLATSVVRTAVLSSGGFGSLEGPNAIFVRLRPGTSPEGGLRSLQRVARELNQAYQSPKMLAASHGASLAGNVNLLSAQRPAEIVNYRSMDTMPTILAGALAAGAVAALGLTLVASVRRRRRDFALLKTMGFTRRQLAEAVAWQSSVIAAAGLVIGVPAGIAAGRWLWLLFARELSAVPDPVIPVVSIAVAALAALILANLVAAVPGWRAARTPTAEVLRSE
jgi:hypothetical protein